MAGQEVEMDSGRAPQKLPFLWSLYTGVAREEKRLILAGDMTCTHAHTQS